METSYPLDDNFTDNGLGLNAEIKSYLYETAKWGKFISIVGFIFVGLLTIVLLMMIAGSSFLTDMPQMAEFGGAAMSFIIGVYGFILVLVILAYFFPCLYLYRSSTKMRMALDTNDQVSLSESFKNMKSFFKFIGILTAIIVGFYVMGILGAMLF